MIRGKIIKGTEIIINRDNLKLVIFNIINPPINNIKFLRAIEAPAPTIDCIKVVSIDILDKTSVVLFSSK